MVFILFSLLTWEKMDRLSIEPLKPEINVSSLEENTLDKVKAKAEADA